MSILKKNIAAFISTGYEYLFNAFDDKIMKLISGTNNLFK
jgi:hypothetical protein